MRILPVVYVPIRSRVLPHRWELGARYAAAYGCTLITIAAVRPIITTPFALVLAAVTLLGLSLSLLLRQSLLGGDNRFFNAPVLRRLVVIIAFVVSLVFVQREMPELLVPSSYGRTLLMLDARRSVALLMQVFLLFAVCRCLAILDDKDAVLCAVPSFSVMLLLIVVHREPEVVIYFLLWAMTTAVLFALDHRSESRFGVSGSVPPVVPGQDVTLSARSLITVVGFSLLCAIGLSYALTSRDPDERGAMETWIMALASRLNRFASDLPETSLNAAPERQIDFSTGPVLPTRTPLWKIRISTFDSSKAAPPDHLRMFTLARYDGVTWAQLSSSEAGEISVLPTRRTRGRQRPWYGGYNYGGGYNGYGGNIDAYSGSRSARYNSGYITVSGHNVADRMPRREQWLRAFGPPRERMRQQIQSLHDNLGYLPLLPVVREVRLFTGKDNIDIKARADSSIYVGPMLNRQGAVVVSEAAVGSPPASRGQQPNPRVRLSPAERATYLQLPSKLPFRVRALAKRITRAGEKRDAAASAIAAVSKAAMSKVAMSKAAERDGGESDYARARRLATYVQSNARYTLRPPVTPSNRDAVDYFLFDSRLGYCTYFASALTVLCRASGIPARIVSGFAVDWTNDPRLNIPTATVVEANAHAWTEVWIDGWGWAALDATAPDDRGDNAPGFLENWTEALGTVLNSSWAWLSKNVLMLSAVLVFGAATAGLFFARRHDLLDLVDVSGLAVLGSRMTRRGRGAGDNDNLARSAILQMYQRASRALVRRYRGRASWETPQEWLQEAEDALKLHDSQPLRTLTELYLRATYSTRPLGTAEAETARRALSALSWRRNRDRIDSEQPPPNSEQ